MSPDQESENTIDIDQLADRLARGELPASDHAALWRRLLFSVVLPRAQRLEGQLGCDQLVNNVLEKLPRRLGSYRQEKGRFTSWLETTLRNLARDEVRARRRCRNLSPRMDVADHRQPNDGDESGAAQEDRDNRLEQALEQLGQTPASKRQKTDFHAVLLISFRLATVSRLKRSRKALAVWGETRTGRAEQQLPWSEADAARKVQADWPGLEGVWDILVEGLEVSGRNPTDDRVVALLADLPGVVGLNAETWRQWRKRAVAWGIRHLGLETWQADVESWLETRAPRRSTAQCRIRR